MSTLSRYWAGSIYGTNTGNVFVELLGDRENLHGTLRVQDHQYGLAVYDISGGFDGTTLTVHGRPREAPHGIELGEIDVSGKLTENGQIKGIWSSTLGTSGPFILHPHDQDEGREQENRPADHLDTSQQLHTATRAVGAVRLYAEDVKHLVEYVSVDFTNTIVIVSFRERGIEKSMFAAEFLKESERLGEHRYLRLYLQEPDAYGLIKFVNVRLDAEGDNEIRVQGAQESWVTGKAESLSALLRNFEKPLATSFRKYGLNVNGFMLLFVIALIPDLDFWRRVAFLVAVVVLVAVVAEMHKKFIPNTVIYLSPRKPGSLGRAMPTILSWALAFTSALVAALAYGLIKGEIPTPW